MKSQYYLEVEDNEKASCLKAMVPYRREMTSRTAYDTYVLRQKRTGRDYLVEIMLQWLIRLMAILLPVGDWN